VLVACGIVAHFLVTAPWLWLRRSAGH
jgi:hypothetical protein